MILIAEFVGFSKRHQWWLLLIFLSSTWLHSNGQVSKDNLFKSHLDWQMLEIMNQLRLGNPDEIEAPTAYYVVELKWRNAPGTEQKIDSVCKSCDKYHVAFQLGPLTAIIERYFIKSPTTSFVKISKVIHNELHFKLDPMMGMHYVDDKRTELREAYVIRDEDNKIISNKMLMLYKVGEEYNLIEVWRLMEDLSE